MGQAYQPTCDDVKSAVSQAVSDLGENTKNAEIAFFGGSFTAIDRSYMLSLLNATKDFIDKFKGIRISTRPDCIDAQILGILKSYKVTSIELGAQSMDDGVLFFNERGHSSDDVRNASALIKSYDISLGLQMMTGLYKSDFYKDIYTADEFIKLRPDTVRIYPTVIMKDTALADYFLSGRFVPYTLEQSVDLCSQLILKFESENISIIRLGLHYSDSLLSNSLSDNYHPAFKELCENRIFYKKLALLIKEHNGGKKITVFVNQRSLSKLIGQKRRNITEFEKQGYELEIKTDNTLSKYDIYIN